MSNPALKTGHVALNVADLNRSIEFYAALFDFEVLARSDADRKYAFLGEDGVVRLTLWQQSEGAFPTGLPGLHHLSFEVPTVDAVRRAEETLKTLGVEFAYDGIVAHAEGAASGGIFFTDPDGIRLEIYAATGVNGTTAPVQGAPTCGFF
ncbi:VOC family protein [Actinomadura madurae]|uniref:VOC family protein n=1 Tax=Actinomadura madurae TaxID=1993 RepID=UPI000D80E8F9|nr:VOC family protein [Actinomadura madurae]SPT58954.1 Catechol-2,3-dioxygenase [Actinomadura madurae]